MAFRTSLRTALLCLTVFGLLASAHASYNFYLALDGNYPYRAPGPPANNARPGRPSPPTDLYPCFSFSFFAPPLVAGGSIRRFNLMSTSAQDLTRTKLPSTVNKILVDRLPDTFSAALAAAVTNKTVYPTLALSCKWTGSSTVNIPVRAFLLTNARITAVRSYTLSSAAGSGGSASIKMEELTITFDHFTDMIVQIP